MSSGRFPALAHALRFGALAAWCGVVWFLSAQSDPGARVGFRLDLPDWAEHGIEYAVGGLLARNALAPVLPRRATVVAFVLCLLWALLDEWHQSFVPGRDPSMRDVLADAVGTSVGIAVHALLTRRRDA